MRRFGLILALFSGLGCSKLKRDYTLELGGAASAADQALSAYYERRQAVALNVPQATIDEIASSMRGDLDGKVIAAPDAEKAKTDATGLFKISHQLDKVSFTPCIKDIALAGTGRGKVDLELTVRSCGFKIEIGAGEVKIEPPPAGDKPVILTVRSLKLKRIDSGEILRFRVGLALRQDGNLEILGVHLSDGLRELTDPAAYDVDVALSGAEAATGWLGKSVNEARTMLLEQVLVFARAQIVLSIERGMQRAVEGAAKRVTRASLVKGFSIKATGFEAKVAGRLSGLSGTPEAGLTLVASALMTFQGLSGGAQALVDGGPVYKCSIGHGTLPDAKPRWVGEVGDVAPVAAAAGIAVGASPAAGVAPSVSATIASGPPVPAASGAAAGGAAASSTSPDPTPPVLARGRVFLPYELLTHGAWLLAGDGGDCGFPIAFEQEALGDLHVLWSSAVALNISPATHRGRPAAKITLHFDSLGFAFSPALTAKLKEAGVPPESLPASIDLPLALKDLDYSFYAEIEPASATAPARLFLAVEDQEKYAGSKGYPWQLLASDALGKDGAAATIDAQTLLRGLAHSLLDQTLAPLFGAQALAISNDAHQAVALESLEIQDSGLAASFAVAVDTTLAANEGANLLSAPPGANAFLWLERLQILGFPALVGLPRAQAAGFSTKNFPAPAFGWSCQDDTAAPIPGPDFSTVGIGYRRCVRSPDDSVELAWTSASLGQEHDSQRRDIVVAERLTAPATGGAAPLPALLVSNLLAAITATPKVQITPPTAQITWAGDGLVVIASGFCRGADPSLCTAARIISSDILQVVELKAYVP